MIDKVRSSRDGHEFHEAWTARRALQLLLPNDNLIGIAVEGLSPVDHSQAASETVEIADIVLYYGQNPTFQGADTVSIVQFKYSVSSSNVEFRCSDARKTIEKFAAAYLDHIKNYGEKEVREKLQFELITNRPIYPALEEAIVCIAEKKPLTGEVKKQADQFKAACGLDGAALVEFASKCRITGFAGSLPANKRDLSRILVDWTAAADTMARARLGGMKQLVRNKAGSEGENRNVIRLTDVLDALEVQDENDLFPCPASFPDVGEVVEREQLAEAIALIPKLDKPLLIHAAGGVGKTVFLESLAKAISDRHEVILFDCFGGGAYRAPEDSRHLPKHGLVHIANILACHGRCDPLLPGSENLEGLVKTFRRRLTQSVETLRRVSPDMEIVLFIDAIDNAAEHASERNEPSSPKVLLDSFQYGGQIPGIRLVVTCRTHRKAISKGDVDCIDFPLKPFSLAETELYLRGRLKEVSQAEIQVAQARSGGNARILEHLVTSDRGLLDRSEIDNPITLDELLSERIKKALSAAKQRGYKKEKTDAFLAGLAVLPPPVPIDEYAGAHGMDVSEIESFAADLAPLLERTKYGLMFRDEPTETLIRQDYASDLGSLGRVARNLLARQDSSVYAARSLPGLLQKLDDGEALFKLAFDERFPESITSTFGKRNICYARLKAAVLHSACKQDNNRLVHLLIELSTIAAVDSRGIDYILDYPDLVITAQDVDATRRLFETRTNWPGTRHARLAIANTLSGDFDDAYRHAVRAEEWIFHYRQKDWESHEERAGPDQLDIAAIPLCLIKQNRAEDAILFMRGWKDWYSYEVTETLFSLLEQAEPMMSQSSSSLDVFLDSLTDEIGVIASAISFVEIDSTHCKELIKKLTKACKKWKLIESNSNFHRDRRHVLQDGLLKASAIAASIGLGKEALKIFSSVTQKRPDIRYFHALNTSSLNTSDSHVFPFLAHAALISAVKGTELRERDILPKELVEICSALRNAGSGSEFRKKLLERLKDGVRSNQKQSQNDAISMSHEEQWEAERYINEKLEPLLALTKAWASLLGAPVNEGDKAFVALLDVWEETRKKPNYNNATYQFDRFFQLLGCQIAVFSLWARSDLKAASVKSFLERLHEQEILDAPIIIEVVALLARKSPLHELAGEEALKARSLIEQEHEVTHRASLFGQLARSISPASSAEATAYFKVGLEQMDAIGSGDYKFTNELLLFASSLKGNELSGQDFHTLTNICELNMPYEEEKFPWFAFAKGLSRTSGCNGLAKLARWDDRSKISLDYTLLPYLTALIDDDKIEPEDALVLMRLSNPVELYSCDTATFAKAIDSKCYPSQEKLISELIQQFEDNNPNIPMDSTVKILASLAEKILGKTWETTVYLNAAHGQFKKVRDENNEHMNYHGQSDIRSSQRVESEVSKDDGNRAKLKELIARTAPNDETAIGRAVDELNDMQDSFYDFKGEFFASLRENLAFSDRAQYIEIVSRLEHLDLYLKLGELEKCKEEWCRSSASLSGIYKKIGIPLLQLHIEDFVSFEQLSGYELKKVSDLSEVPVATLVLELIKIFASPDWDVSASVWLGLASIICGESDGGQGQAALSRLLNSNSAKLASKVVDGEWKKGLYPSNDPTEIIAGFVWRMLGSPRAVDRWRAAHSVRCLARFERWSVIDALVARMGTEHAHPFQAPELPFYYLHARLWLVIALARIAMNDPEKVANYRNVLKEVVLDENSPHVLMRHFAAQAILTCVERGILTLSAQETKKIRDINVSPFPRLIKHLETGGRRFFDHGRPEGVPKPETKFYLDYDFDKNNVQCLSDVFGKPSWEVKDMITEAVHRYDAKTTSMHDSGGRKGSRSEDMSGMTSSYHSYGQQLAWHALFLTAGRLLAQYPVTDDSYADEPWAEWLNTKLITRQDGLWLSDGIDRPPLDTKINLLEKGEDGLVITGDKAKILSLIAVDSALQREIVVEGKWSSPDKIKVHISSALVAPGNAKSLARALILEKPFSAWLPTYNEYENEDEYLSNNEKDYIPWIVCPSWEARLDEDDPLGARCAMVRPHFAENVVTTFSLVTDDPFSRIWKNSAGKTMAHSDAWGCENEYEDEASYSGVRLMCSRELLRDVLTTQNVDLLVLVKLKRYENRIGIANSRFSHTVAVVHIMRTLDFEYFEGAINTVH
jgi:hypothetical protein